MISECCDEVEGEKLTTEAQYVQYQWVKRGEVAPGCTAAPQHTHGSPAKEHVAAVAQADLASLGNTNRDNDYGIVTMNDVRPCTPLLNKGSRTQTLYGHVGMAGQHCVCAHMSPSACKARHDSCSRGSGGELQQVPAQPSQQASTLARQPIGAQYFLLDPDVIADGRPNHQHPPQQHPVRMFTLRGSRENGIDETYQMRTFKPPTASPTSTAPTSNQTYQVHPKPDNTGTGSGCDAAPNTQEPKSTREIERDNHENEIRNTRATNMVR